MKPIRLYSCEKCNPFTWEVIGQASSDHYKCDWCGKRTDKILKNRFYKPFIREED